MKKSALAALNAAAGRQPVVAPVSGKTPENSVLIGAHYPRQVRKALKLVEAETGRMLKPLLGEAINHLCAKYGVPQPYNEETA